MTPYYQDSLVMIYHGDMRDVMPSLTADLMPDPDPLTVPEDWDSSILAWRRAKLLVIPPHRYYRGRVVIILVAAAFIVGFVIGSLFR